MMIHLLKNVRLNESWLWLAPRAPIQTVQFTAQSLWDRTRIEVNMKDTSLNDTEWMLPYGCKLWQPQPGFPGGLATAHPKLAIVFVEFLYQIDGFNGFCTYRSFLER